MSSTRVANYNQLETKSIQLILDRCPHVEYFCTSASIPGLSTSPVQQWSPFAAPIAVTGDNITFQPLIVNFIIDENMKNWEELFDWFVSYSHPSSFEEYQDSSFAAQNLYSSKKSSATVLIPNNKYNTTHEFVFDDIFPIDMSDVVFDVQIDGVVSAVCTATFAYTVYRKIKR